jgi:hypothetical protein
MEPKSIVEAEIIAALKASGGTYSNAYSLIVRDLGRAWSHGYRCLDNLERRGLITVEHGGPHRPTVIHLVTFPAQVQV